jgi:hypothetical protein
METRINANAVPVGTRCSVFGFKRVTDWTHRTGEFRSGLVAGVRTAVADHPRGMVKVTFEDGSEVYAVPYAVAFVQHADALDPGQRNPYDAQTGEFIARCVCGREFRDAGEPFAADIRMMEHVTDPDLTDDEIERALA